MANRKFVVASFTIEAVAHTVTMAANKFMGLMGGSSTQRIKIKEVKLGGLEPTNSSPVIMLLSRDSTVNVTPTALNGTTETDAAEDPSTAALAAPPVSFTTASTRPQRSATLGIDNFAFNALGGLYRNRYPIGEEPSVLGNTASLGEVSLSGFTGSSLVLMGGAITYEPL